MSKIKFGTDGWRAIIADDFTVQNVARVAKATALWLKKGYDKPSVCIGSDCRFGGKLFVDTCVSIFLEEGVQVFRANNLFVSTPMVSLGTFSLGANLGVVITASHNPPTYNGYKLKSGFGGPLHPDLIAEVEDLIPNEVEIPSVDFGQYEQEDQLIEVDLEELYLAKVRQNFEIQTIENTGFQLAYDAMYGAGQNVITRLFDQAELLHCEYNPSFFGTAPEPIHKNLIEFSEWIKSLGSIDLGLATDGDADRIGLYNPEGEFVDSHRIILLLIHYLVNYKEEKGKVVTAFSTSERIAKLCDAYGIEHITTKIGFKYIAPYMMDGETMLGGEESGGIAISGFIPERDGIWIGLTLMQFMATTGKSLNDLLDEVYEVVGDFAYERNDLRLPEEQKMQIVEHCKNGDYQSFGDLEVQNVRTIDGFKFELPNETYVLIRSSGTEPLLRVYCEAKTKQDVEDTLQKVKDTILV